MIFLTATTDKIQTISSVAAALDVVSSYVDAVTATGAFAGTGRQLLAHTTASTQDAVSAPGASNTRNVKQMTIRNKDASATTDVTVQLNANGTLYELHKVSLSPGDMLQYIEGVGFFEITNVSRLNEAKYVTADYVNATTSFTSITGLSWSVKSGKVYAFEACLMHIENATTTGAQFAIGGVAMTFMQAASLQAQTAAAGTTSAIIQSGAVAAVDTAVIVATAGQTSILPTWFAGSFQPSADGTLVLKGASEVAVAAGLTVKKGSWALVRETAN